MTTITLTAQVTPNPNTLKFVLDRQILEKGSIDFQTTDKAEKSPVVKALFEIKGVSSVLVGVNFVSVTKGTDIDWTDIAENITSTIKEVAASTDELVDPELAQENAENSNDTEVEKKIKQILDTEIRPAVAMDGGDITFDRFEDGYYIYSSKGLVAHVLVL